MFNHPLKSYLGNFAFYDLLKYAPIYFTGLQITNCCQTINFRLWIPSSEKESHFSEIVSQLFSISMFQTDSTATKYFDHEVV